MALKLKACDTWFSKCVREAADWTCEKSGVKFERGSMGLHCSHIFSRRHRTIRWCKENAQALSYNAHQWFGANPADSAVWLEETLGEGHIQLLREKRDSRVKIPRSEEKAIATWYKNEHDKLIDRRMNGETGKLDFLSYQ